MASTAVQGHEAVFSLTDTGIGIAPEHLPHIFDRFYRVDAARRMSPHTGSGLGLSVIYSQVTQAGGDIVARSRRGEGTRFDIYLPWRADRSAPVEI